MRSWQAFVAVVGWLVGSVASPAWAELQWVDRAVSGPSPRCEFGFAYDSAREVAVLFGGSSDLSFEAVNAETWEWNGAEWALRATAGPPARCDNAFAYDSARQRVVSFGGFNGAYLNDTWEWDGTAWTPMAAVGPTPRADSFMAFDSARNVMVLFGGQGALGGILRDTWEYDGTAWTRRATTGPAPRWIQRMAFDRARGVVVMYGGANPFEVLSDTWEWNGTAWTQNVVAGPPARFGNGMCYDVLRSRSVVYGGQTGGAFGENPVGDTWLFDGTQWTELAIPGPPARTFVKMVYDEARHRAVVFGGWADQPLGDTWELMADESSVDVPRAGSPGMALAGFRPNPPSHELRVAFTLARSESTRLEILDVSGRRLLDRHLGVMGPGNHVVSLGSKPKLAPGVYMLRLSQGSQSVTTRGVISK